ncbi:MAG: cyanophycin synthetase [Deltaproteobacteria bacterium]|nr:cyanophycin synthetase [Deltaproteobacteria bacterium]MBT4527416.1 cyanophycin synthetase [Deltaproteobacteria bacterium]
MKQTIKKFIYQWIEKQFMDGCSHYNSLSVRKSCRSKQQARKIFNLLNIPHANGKVFFNPFKALDFVKEHGFPVVIKPNVSGYSRGSYFPIRNMKEFWKAALFVKIWWPTSIIEQYLEGKNYRVVVVKDEIMSVLRRYQPFVIGNGINTISELIDQENEKRKKMLLYPVIHSIPKTNRVKKFLKKQGLYLRTVPNTNEIIQLHNKIALAPGGVVETLDKNSMAPENRELFLNLQKKLDANILGIDAIFEKGIETSHDKQKTIFLEINSRPYLKMHDYPRFGIKQDLQPYYQKLNQIELIDSGIF